MAIGVTGRSGELARDLAALVSQCRRESVTILHQFTVDLFALVNVRDTKLVISIRVQ